MIRLVAETERPEERRYLSLKPPTTVKIGRNQEIPQLWDIAYNLPVSTWTPTLHPTLVKVPYMPNKKTLRHKYLLKILCVGIVLMRNPILKKEHHYGKAERRV